MKSTEDYLKKIEKLREIIDTSGAIVIGGGAGLSTSAGFIYGGERFEKCFTDFEAKYCFHDMYSGGFCTFGTQEEYWAFWSRCIWINRYMDPPKPVYDDLMSLMHGKNYFVITTNVDHCFQKAGADKTRLFYTQGDFGLFQCSKPCRKVTYNNEDIVKQMMLSQGYEIEEDKTPALPGGHKPSMTISSKLIPKCPKCGRPITMNLRGDDRFVEDAGWHIAARRYSEFLEDNKDKKMLFLELGVGMNTPGIIKFPFWKMTYNFPNAFYACINLDDAYAPDQIKDRSLCIAEDIGEVIKDLLGKA